MASMIMVYIASKHSTVDGLLNTVESPVGAERRQICCRKDTLYYTLKTHTI